MSFLRPQAEATLRRYREAIIGVLVLLLGLWWAIGSLGLVKWTGVVVALFGAMIVWSGLRHARIQVGDGGLGVVEIKERQIVYMAPVGGGFASLDYVSRIEIAPDRAGLPVWRFVEDEQILTIPVRAEGAADLFDALTALSGADIDGAIRAANGRPHDTVVIWYRSPIKLH